MLKGNDGCLVTGEEGADCRQVAALPCLWVGAEEWTVTAAQAVDFPLWMCVAAVAGEQQAGVWVMQVGSLPRSYLRSEQHPEQCWEPWPGSSRIRLRSGHLQSCDVDTLSGLGFGFLKCKMNPRRLLMANSPEVLSCSRSSTYWPCCLSESFFPWVPRRTVCFEKRLHLLHWGTPFLAQEELSAPTRQHLAQIISCLLWAHFNAALRCVYRCVLGEVWTLCFSSLCEWTRSYMCLWG